MGLLDGTLQSIIGSAVDFILYDITLSRETVTHTVGTGSTTASTDYSCRGFVDTDVQTYLEQKIINEGDRVVLITQTSLSVSPVKGDKITARGKVSTVMDVGQDPAQATWVLGVSP
jgi:hypothetical protein